MSDRRHGAKRTRQPRGGNGGAPGRLALTLLGAVLAICTLGAFFVVGRFANPWLGGLAALVVGTLSYVAWRSRAGRPISRPTRERIVSRTCLLTLGTLGTLGLAAFLRDTPDIPPADPPQPYIAIAGYLSQAWLAANGEPGDVLDVQPANGTYWRAIVADSKGCWSASVVLDGNSPAYVPSPTPVACPVLRQAKIAVGDVVRSPATDPAASAAVRFYDRWLEKGDISLLVSPESGIRDLTKRLSVTEPIIVYTANKDDLPETDERFWLTTTIEGRTVGALIIMSERAPGRWEVQGVRGGPPAQTTFEPIPPPTTTTSILDKD